MPDIFSEFWFQFGIVLSGIIGVFVWLGYRNHRDEKLRRETYSQLAEELSANYSPEIDKSLVPFLPNFWLFAQGRSQAGYAEHVLHGKIGEITFSLLNFTYHGRSPLSGQKHSDIEQTVVCLEGEGLNLPSFTVGPNQSFESEHLGIPSSLNNVTFPEFPDFSQRYSLWCSDEEAARNIFNDELIGHIEEYSGLDEISLEGQGNALLVYHWGWPMPPSDIRKLLEAAFGFYGPLKDRSGQNL